MDNFLYKCQYCGKDYKPNRRKKQIYCSNSCRTRAFQIRKKAAHQLSIINSEKKIEKKSESMSWAGVGNAAAGNLAANMAVNLFTANENKPATKKDLKMLANSLKERYQIVRNLPQKMDGTTPFYDIQTNVVVYLNKPNQSWR